MKVKVKSLRKVFHVFCDFEESNYLRLHPSPSQLTFQPTMDHFPIVSYSGEYDKSSDNQWSQITGDGTWYFMDTFKQLKVEDDENDETMSSSEMNTLVGPDDDWGLFNLVGVMQIDRRNAVHVWGKGKTTSINVFVNIGKFLNSNSGVVPSNRVYCIPQNCFGSGVQLTLVCLNILMNTTEVYFLEGKEGVDKSRRSQLPGMGWFYVRKGFENLARGVRDLFLGVCK